MYLVGTVKIPMSQIVYIDDAIRQVRENFTYLSISIWTIKFTNRVS